MEYPILKPRRDNRYELIEAYIYKDILVPKGYITNGANIPRLLWNIIPPFKPKYMHAVVIHDYLCDLEEYEKADLYFEELLYEVEKNIYTMSMVSAVKLYHKIKY